MDNRARRALWYAVPAIGAAIPVALMLAKRSAEASCEARETKDEALLRESHVDIRTAMGSALKYVSGTPVEIELQEEYGIPVWEVEIVPKEGGPTREVLIDARNGELLQMRAEQVAKCE